MDIIPINLYFLGEWSFSMKLFKSIFSSTSNLIFNNLLFSLKSISLFNKKIKECEVKKIFELQTTFSFALQFLQKKFIFFALL